MSLTHIQSEINLLLAQEKTLRERRQALERQARTEYQRQYIKETQR